MIPWKIKEIVGVVINESDVTMPAPAHDSQRQAARDARMMPGTGVMRFIKEALAAMSACDLDKKVGGGRNA